LAEEAALETAWSLAATVLLVDEEESLKYSRNLDSDPYIAAFAARSANFCAFERAVRREVWVLPEQLEIVTRFSSALIGLKTRFTLAAAAPLTLISRMLDLNVKALDRYKSALAWAVPSKYGTAPSERTV
jgi:hypothetical protein